MKSFTLSNTSKTVRNSLIVIILVCLAINSNQNTVKITPYHELTISLVNSTALAFTLNNMDAQAGWVGIGFGGNLMENVDYNIFFWLGTFSIQDAWSFDYDTPRADTSLGGTSDIKSLTQTTGANGNYIISYERLLDTGDQYDHKFVDGDNDLVVAWWNDDYTKHGSFVKTGNIKIDLANNTVDISVQRYIIYEVHGLGLLFTWSILNIFSYMAGRLLKHLPIFRWIHGICSGIVGIITLVFGILGIAKGKSYV